MTFRVEEKISLSMYDSFLFYNLLTKLGVKKLYEERIVKSVYFDNNKFTMFNESEEGIRPRKKIRIREYLNNQNKDLLLEKKISSDEGRYKISKKINLETKKNYLNNGYLDKTYGLCFPKNIIIYKRFYYKLMNIRITHDRNIEYYKYTNLKYKARDESVVFEIKASIIDKGNPS